MAIHLDREISEKGLLLNRQNHLVPTWGLGEPLEGDDLAALKRSLLVHVHHPAAGYVCAEPRAEFYAQMDAANVDLKAFSERFYREVCGGHLQPVLDTLTYLKHETDVWFEITTLLIPGENDSDGELDELSSWVAEELGVDVPLHFTAFHPDWKMRDRPPTPPATLARAREIARGKGLRYVYTGNVHDRKGGSTYCHECGERIIGRDWYVLTDWRLDEQGRCAVCKTPCAGHFEAEPGTWGARRQPVRLANFS